jgi:hypothetical protein
MDGTVTFSHEGKEYSAKVIGSENLSPHYYWLLFKEAEMQRQLGEDVAFVVKEGKLKSIHPSLAKRNIQLMNEIKAALEKHLQKI